MSNRKRKGNERSESKFKKYRKNDYKVPLKRLSIPLIRCDQNKITIDDLPVELLLRIFSYLTYIERKNISLVSKKWNALSSDALLNLFFTVGPKMPLSKVRQMLYEAPYLKNFKIAMRNDLKSILYTLSRCNTNVTNVKIEKCFKCKVSTFMQLSNCCPRLRSLAINNTVVSYGHTFKCNTTVFENLQKLTTVNSCIHNNRSCTNNRNQPITTIFLMKLFQRCKNLKYIKISLPQIQSNLLNDEFVYNLCRMTNYNLIGLCLDAQELTDQSVEWISMCKNLKVLKLANANKITTKSVHILETIYTLKTMHLTYAKRIGRSAWTSLFTQPWMEHLQSLNLTGSKRINDHMLNIISKNCKSLTHLKLSKCKLITDEGIGTIIKGCNNLTNLNIKDTQRVIAKSLTLIAQHLKTLSVLQCDKRHIQRRVKNQLISSCPNLIIK